jgi:hypothetical protein
MRRDSGATLVAVVLVALVQTGEAAERAPRAFSFLAEHVVVPARGATIKISIPAVRAVRLYGEVGVSGRPTTSGTPRIRVVLKTVSGKTVDYGDRGCFERNFEFVKNLCTVRTSLPAKPMQAVDYLLVIEPLVEGPVEVAVKAVVFDPLELAPSR